MAEGKFVPSALDLELKTLFPDGFLASATMFDPDNDRRPLERHCEQHTSVSYAKKAAGELKFDKHWDATNVCAVLRLSWDKEGKCYTITAEAAEALIERLNAYLAFLASEE